MDGYESVMTLAADPERGSKWLPVVVAAYWQSRRTAAYGGRFAGAWVVNDLGGWVPSLRLLAAAGILEKSGDTVRGGRRAYYRMPDADGVEKALRQLDLLGPQRYLGIDDFIVVYAGTLDRDVPLAIQSSPAPSFGFDIYAGDDHFATVALLPGETRELLNSRLHELRGPAAT
jgi:hypothetical protein